LIFPSSTTITTFLRSESPRPSKRFPHFNATVFDADIAVDVCATQNPATASAKQSAAICRFMIPSTGDAALDMLNLGLTVY
jgi:hypothetical protein